MNNDYSDITYRKGNGSWVELFWNTLFGIKRNKIMNYDVVIFIFRRIITYKSIICLEQLLLRYRIIFNMFNNLNLGIAK